MTLATSSFSEYYEYTDKNGEIIFTDDLGSIPENQRSKVKEFKEQKHSPPFTPPKNTNTTNTPDTGLNNQKSKVETALQKFDSAIRTILELRKNQPEEFVKQYEVALSEHEKLGIGYADDPHSNLMIKNVAYGYLNLGDFFRFNLRLPRKAVASYQKSAELSDKMNDPGSFFTEVRLADNYQFNLRDKANAIKYYRRALAHLSANSEKQRGVDPFSWWKLWLEHEIQYITTGQPFSAAIDRETLGAFPMTAMVFMADIMNRGMIQFDTGIYLNESPITDGVDSNLNRNIVFQKLQKLPVSHLTLGATIYAIPYLPTPESILIYLESQDPGRYWSASILCSAVLYKMLDPPELSKVRSLLFPGTSGASSLLQVAADQFQKRSGVHCAVEPDKRFASPEKTWEYLINSLKQGNAEAALSCLTPRLKEKFRGLFSKMPSDEMNQMAKSFSGFSRTKDSGSMNEYVVLRHVGGRDMMGFIYFINSSGEWKIDEM